MIEQTEFRKHPRVLIKDCCNLKQTPLSRPERADICLKSRDKTWPLATTHPLRQSGSFFSSHFICFRNVFENHHVDGGGTERLCRWPHSKCHPAIIKSHWHHVFQEDQSLWLPSNTVSSHDLLHSNQTNLKQFLTAYHLRLNQGQALQKIKNVGLGWAVVVHTFHPSKGRWISELGTSLVYKESSKKASAVTLSWKTNTHTQIDLA